MKILGGYKFMDNLEITKDGKGEILTFSGKILKENIRDIKDLLIDAIDRAENIVIEFHDLKKTDMFFVQLLCSVHKYALLKKKKIDILKPFPDALKTILEDFGFIRDKGCSKEVEENCFWLKEVTNV